MSCAIVNSPAWEGLWRVREKEESSLLKIRLMSGEIIQPIQGLSPFLFLAPYRIKPTLKAETSRLKRGGMSESL